MTAVKEKSFDHIHELTANGLLNKARHQLVNTRTGQLRKGYAWDPNHAWYCVGDIQFRLSDFKGAVQAFRRAYQADQNDAQSLLAIGNCHDAMGKPRSSERVLRKALELKVTGRGKAAILFNLGNALFDQKKFDEAIAMYSQIQKRRDEIGKAGRKNLNLAITCVGMQ